MALALPAPERAGPSAPAPRLWREPKAPRPVLEPPRLSVLIVNYRLWGETARLVRQLLAAPCTQRGDVEVVVVDNHSPPHPLAKRLRRWPGVSLRRWGRNRGFAQAVNEGCRLSRGQWLLVLNPDISMPETFLPGVLSLVDHLAAREPRTGVVGFHLRNRDGTHQLSSGPFPTLPQVLARLLLPRQRRKYHFVRPRRRTRVPWVTGCCFLVRRSCLEQLGGLDGDFFLYYEDVDLCQRARRQGWAVWYEPGLRVIHQHPLHSRPMPTYLRLLTRHALLTYARKHWPRWQFRLLAGLIACEAHLRRYLAARQQDGAAVRLFGQLRALAADMAGGRLLAARRRLEQIVRRRERRHAS